MYRARFFGLSVVLGLTVTAAASAETAYTTRAVNLRAGPSREYPLVLRLEPGTPVDVAGCLDDWTWCDVIAGADRGWVYAGSLEYPYQDRRVPIITSGPAIGLPIVVYSVGPYWDTYYRGRPWYGRRTYWVQRSPLIRRSGLRPPGARSPAVARPPRPVNRPQPFRPGRSGIVRPQPQRVRPDVARPEVRPRLPHPGRGPAERRPPRPPHES